MLVLREQGQSSDHKMGRCGEAAPKGVPGSRSSQGVISSCWYMKVSNCCQLAKYR